MGDDILRSKGVSADWNNASFATRRIVLVEEKCRERVVCSLLVIFLNDGVLAKEAWETSRQPTEWWRLQDFNCLRLQ